MRDLSIRSLHCSHFLHCFLAALSIAICCCTSGEAKEGESATSDNRECAAGTGGTEAPAAFDNKTNDFEPQDKFDDDLKTFQEIDTPEKGLGPVYNATSCVDCHQNPVIGSSSQISEIRAGFRAPKPGSPGVLIFVEPPGGSLIHQRAIDPAIQEHVRPKDKVRTLRMSNTTLGNGFVEVIPDACILEVRQSQPHGMKGYPVIVDVLVTATKASKDKVTFTTAERLGRFGWKCQEASLLNFSANAYINEIGITSPSQMIENTSMGNSVAAYDKVTPEPEDKITESGVDHLFGVDVEAFTRFMRSTKAPPQDSTLAANELAKKGKELFEKIGCAICHHPSYTTPKAGTPIVTRDGKPGSDMPSVSDALGDKTIHPYSDFMLHNVGTGDGIAQTQHAQRKSTNVEKTDKLPDNILERDGIIRVEETSSGSDEKARALADKPDAKELDQHTANMVRTAPLWGLRVRPQLMHDGLSLTIDEAIRRHRVQAEGVKLRYESLSSTQRNQLLTFLRTL